MNYDTNDRRISREIQCHRRESGVFRVWFAGGFTGYTLASNGLAFTVFLGSERVADFGSATDAVAHVSQIVAGTDIPRWARNR